MNYMDVSRLVGLSADGAAGDISQIQDEQSALSPPEKIARGRPPTRNACTTTKTALPEQDVVQPARGQLLAAKIGVSGAGWVSGAKGVGGAGGVSGAGGPSGGAGGVNGAGGPSGWEGWR